MKTYEGSCHCRAVRFSFRAPEIQKAMRCDCSICVRKGIMMTAKTVPPEDMTVLADEGALSLYQFGTFSARHRFCVTCGVHVFVETRLNPGHFRVNLGCIEGLDPLRLPEEIYDGKSL